MSDRIVSLVGPFNDRDLREIWETLQRIEARDPAKTYRLIVDDKEAEGRPSFMEAMKELDDVFPATKGYQRVTGYRRRN